MAVARLALRNLQQRGPANIGGVQRRKWGNEFLKRFMATTAANDGTKEGTKEVAMNDKGSRLFPRRRGSKRSLWRNNDSPLLYEIFPSGIGNALMQATENINRLFESLNISSPRQLMGRVKEQDDCYKLRYEMPGLGKDDVKITIHDGVLTIKGERKEEVEEGSEEDDDGYWSARRYGYYNRSLVLPDDAKAEDVKAELKDGVLSIVIPRTENPNKDVKEVKIH